MGKSNILEQRPTFHNTFLSFKATKHGTKKENKTSLHHITSNESFYINLGCIHVCLKINVSFHQKCSYCAVKHTLNSGIFN